MKAPNTGEVVTVSEFGQISRCISEMVQDMIIVTVEGYRRNSYAISSHFISQALSSLYLPAIWLQHRQQSGAAVSHNQLVS